MRIIYWGKRILTITAIMLWIKVIIKIADSTAPFIEQAPYCMISTMMIFGLLSILFKGLDWWENQG